MVVIKTGHHWPQTAACAGKIERRRHTYAEKNWKENVRSTLENDDISHLSRVAAKSICNRRSTTESAIGHYRHKSAKQMNRKFDNSSNMKLFDELGLGAPNARPKIMHFGDRSATPPKTSRGKIEGSQKM